MDAIVAAVAASSMPESGADDQGGDTDADDEVAKLSDAAQARDQHDHASGTADHTITEYKLLHRAIFSPTDGTEDLRELIDSGIDIDCTDDAGYTSLMVAINSGKGERATVLIRAGADVTKVNVSGFSAFHWAAAKADVRALKQLAQAGAASIDGLRAALAAKTDTGKTPKDLAADPRARVWLERLELASYAELELFACGKSLETATATLAPPSPPRSVAPIAASLLTMAVDVAAWGTDSLTREFFDATDRLLWDGSDEVLDGDSITISKPGPDDPKALRSSWAEAPVWASSGALGF